MLSKEVRTYSESPHSCFVLLAFLLSSSVVGRLDAEVEVQVRLRLAVAFALALGLGVPIETERTLGLCCGELPSPS